MSGKADLPEQAIENLVTLGHTHERAERLVDALAKATDGDTLHRRMKDIIRNAVGEFRETDDAVEAAASRIMLMLLKDVKSVIHYLVDNGEIE